MNISKILTVWFATILTWIVTLAEVQEVVAIATGLSALSYTLWRWRRDYKNSKTKNK
jgi:hypothetical protein